MNEVYHDGNIKENRIAEEDRSAVERGPCAAALGASMLLYFKGITSAFHDIALMVADHDAECVHTILLEMGELRPSDPMPNPMYRTKTFMEFLIESIEVDVMAGFAIVHEGTAYDCSLREEQIVEKMPLGTEVIPLQSPQ